MRRTVKEFTLLPEISDTDENLIPKGLNIILFGPTGSGKSSLIR